MQAQTTPLISTNSTIHTAHPEHHTALESEAIGSSDRLQPARPPGRTTPASNPFTAGPKKPLRGAWTGPKEVSTGNVLGSGTPKSREDVEKQCVTIQRSDGPGVNQYATVQEPVGEAHPPDALGSEGGEVDDRTEWLVLGESHRRATPRA